MKSIKATLSSLICIGTFVLILFSTILTTSLVVANAVDDTATQVVTAKTVVDDHIEDSGAAITTTITTATAATVAATDTAARPMKGKICGKKVCNSEQYCCNRSCSICAPINGVCHKMHCGGFPAIPRIRPISRPISRRSRAQRSLLSTPTTTSTSTSTSTTNQQQSPCIIPKWQKSQENYNKVE